MTQRTSPKPPLSGDTRSVDVTSAEQPPNSESNPQDGPLVASSDSPSTMSVDGSQRPEEFPGVTTESIPVNPAMVEKIAANSDPGSSPANSLSSSNAASSAKGTTDPMVAMSQDLGALTMSTVLVLDVERTEQGRLDRAVRRAMRGASIATSDQKTVSGELAEAATEAAEVGSKERVSLMYIESSAKRLDRFYVALLEDRQGIESVAMHLSFDAPMAKRIERLRPEPTSVVHAGGAASLLDGSEDQLNRLLSEINALPFGKVNRQQVQPLNMGIGTSQDGPDVSARVLVVIR